MTSPTSYMPGGGQRPPRRFGLGAVLGALVAGALLGGGSGYVGAVALGDDTPAAAAIEPAALDAATSAPSSSPAAAADSDRRFAMGKPWSFDNGSTTTVVLRYRANVDDGPDGETLNAIEIRSCMAKTADGPASFNVSPWSLEDADGVSYSRHISNSIAGEYPFDGKTVEPGRCIKGWAVFSMPKGAKPVLAVYEGAGNQGRPAEWKIG